MLSDLEDFDSFVKASGLPKNVGKCLEARKLAEKKRSVIQRVKDSIVESLLKDPIRQREEKRIKVMTELEVLGERLKSAVMTRLNADSILSSIQQGETAESWGARIIKQQQDKKLLASGDLLALAGSARIADEILKQSVGLEDFNWESTLGKQAKLIEKAEKRLQVEIVSTSYARPLDQLPHAEEDKQEA